MTRVKIHTTESPDPSTADDLLVRSARAVAKRKKKRGGEVSAPFPIR